MHRENTTAANVQEIQQSTNAGVGYRTYGNGCWVAVVTSCSGLELITIPCISSIENGPSKPVVHVSSAIKPWDRCLFGIFTFELVSASHR